MDALKAVVFFYEVHSLENHGDIQLAEVLPCLDSIPSGQTLVGRPFAKKVSLEAARSLFCFFIGKDPSEIFPKEFSLEVINEEQLAHRVVCSVIHFMRVRFNSLRRPSDWMELHDYMRCEISQKMKRKPDDGKGNDDKWVQIFEKLPSSPNSYVNVRKSVWMLVNAITPIRVSFLDGQRRATGATYAMLNRKPEESLPQLAQSLDPRYMDQDLLVTNRLPDFDVLSAWVSVDSVRPNVHVTSTPPGGELDNVTLSLLKKHSELIQQESSSARVRKFTDALVGLLSSLEKSKEYRERLVIPGELQMRFETTDKANPRNWPLTDVEKNDKVHTALWDHVIGELFSETAGSVQQLVKNALSNMTAIGSRPGQFRGVTFVFANRQTYELETKCKGGLSLGRTGPRSRQELNSIAMLFANFISGVSSINLLVNLTVMEQGKMVPHLCRTMNASLTSGGKVPGLKDEHGILFGVSFE
jgi:hypothetical protein